jgi:hypothetical protein
MASTVVLKAAGLYTSPNELEREEGSLTTASNIIIRRDGIIEQRRGFKLFGISLPSPSDRVKQLASYRNRILRHYDDLLQYDSTGEGDFVDYTEIVEETEDGLRLKFAESNGNLYFTTSQGIKRLSAKSNDQLDDIEPEMAGTVKALDLDAEVIYTDNNQTGFLTQDSTVAYRVVWNKKDNNGNLGTGSPSQREIVYNSLLYLMLKDYVRILRTLDDLENNSSIGTACHITDRDYFMLALPATATATQLRTNLISLASEVDNDLMIANETGVCPLAITGATITSGICTVDVPASGSALTDPTDYWVPGSKIYLTGFIPTTGTLDGAQTIVSVSATQITFNTAATGTVSLSSATIHSNWFRSITQPAAPSSPATNTELVAIQDYLDAIILQLQELPDAIVVPGTDQDAIANLDITTSATVQLNFTIPQEIREDVDYFYQIYRSAVTSATGALVLDDLTPNDELQLVYEDYPTAAELESGEITVEDLTPDDFRGENLYTNASTGEGITQSNDQPPFAKDIAKYRNSLFYANTRTKQRLALNLLGVQNMIDDYDAGTTPKITITNGDTTNTYKFVTGQQEITKVVTVADVSNSLDGKYFLLDSRKGSYYVWFNTSGGSAVDPAISGRTGIEVELITDDADTDVALALYSELVILIDDFIVTVDGNEVEITDIDVGEVTDADDGDTGFTITTEQQGRGERIQPQITEVTAVAGSLYTSSGTADYFKINSAMNQNRYVVWFAAGTAVAPSISGATLLEVEVTGSETAAQMATKIAEILPTEKFLAEENSAIVTITNVQAGECDDAQEFVTNAGFTISITQEGAVEVLLSPLVSPARAVEATSKSLIRVINKNEGDCVYAFYLSSVFDIPGKMFLEARSLEDDTEFYVLGNNTNTGASFNPIISPETQITNIATGVSSTVITTAEAHGMENGDEVVIAATDSQPSVDGIYTITYLTSTTFSISAFVSIAGSEGSICRKTTALFSENEEKINRIYYSKTNQPEAVPIVNFFDVGSADKKILRIVALRDSLFVLKEDGLYRISGDIPFQLELFDNSFITIAPDSVAVSNNVVYAWTTQGVQALTEGGAYSSPISRPIDNLLLKTQSYTNFKTATWGVGYESDNSYIVFTVTERADEVATIAYRYSTLTQTWTTYDKTNTCGIVNNFDDKLYLGAADTSYIEQERKMFDRTDYADREIESVIGSGAVLDDNIILPVVTELEIGDVIVQEQTMTVYGFNQLLEKLDLDTGVNDPTFLEDLEMERGDSPRNKLVALATKLDASGLSQTDYLAQIDSQSGSITAISAANPTVITSANHGLIDGRIIRITSADAHPDVNDEYAVTVLSANTFSIPVAVKIPGTTGTWETVDTDFEDIKTCYNKIVAMLNLDNTVSFANYTEIEESTSQESIITDINTITKTVTVNLELDYVFGDITIYKAIQSEFVYSPNTMGDPLMLKHLSESTVLFETRTLTGGTLSFATDLLPEFIDIEFTLDGNGIFGHSPSFGSGFFGGTSNSAPFRTYVPRQCQRCRFVVVKFKHNTAREDYRVLGVTVTGNPQQSTRAYR